MRLGKGKRRKMAPIIILKYLISFNWISRNICNHLTPFSSHHKWTMYQCMNYCCYLLTRMWQKYTCQWRKHYLVFSFQDWYWWPSCENIKLMLLVGLSLCTVGAGLGLITAWGENGATTAVTGSFSYEITLQLLFVFGFVFVFAFVFVFYNIRELF